MNNSIYYIENEDLIFYLLQTQEYLINNPQSRKYIEPELNKYYKELLRRLKITEEEG